MEIKACKYRRTACEEAERSVTRSLFQYHTAGSAILRSLVLLFRVSEYKKLEHNPNAFTPTKTVFV